MILTGCPSTDDKVPVVLIASISEMEILNSLRFSENTKLSGTLISIGTSISYVAGSNMNVLRTLISSKSIRSSNYERFNDNQCY